VKALTPTTTLTVSLAAGGAISQTLAVDVSDDAERGEIGTSNVRISLARQPDIARVYELRTVAFAWETYLPMIIKRE
jgi:hypothetical protein